MLPGGIQNVSTQLRASKLFGYYIVVPHYQNIFLCAAVAHLGSKPACSCTYAHA